jgi:hypothetical protein
VEIRRERVTAIKTLQKATPEIQRFSEHGELLSSSTQVLAAGKRSAPQSADALATHCESATFCGNQLIIDSQSV